MTIGPGTNLSFIDNNGQRTLDISVLGDDAAVTRIAADGTVIDPNQTVFFESPQYVNYLFYRDGNVAVYESHNKDDGSSVLINYADQFSFAIGNSGAYSHGPITSSNIQFASGLKIVQTFDVTHFHLLDYRLDLKDVDLHAQFVNGTSTVSLRSNTYSLDNSGLGNIDNLIGKVKLISQDGAKSSAMTGEA